MRIAILTIIGQFIKSEAPNHESSIEIKEYAVILSIIELIAKKIRKLVCSITSNIIINISFIIANDILWIAILTGISQSCIGM